MGTRTVVVNFGGPRHLGEVKEFLQELLTDHDVVRTRLPRTIHNWLFAKIAQKRSRKVCKDYAAIGGCSPIHSDTEAVAQAVAKQLEHPVHTFHRYLPATHSRFLTTFQEVDDNAIDLFPMFPQFTHATTGSVARWMHRFLPPSLVDRLRWVRSYPDHPAFIAAHQACIRDCLAQHALDERDTFLLFSAHGIPQAFLRCQDPYPTECERTVQKVMEGFPDSPHLLAYQSKFGPGEWLRPYTSEVSARATRYTQGQKHVVVVPISFTSDHIETLFEIEAQYLPRIRNAGLHAYRCPALTTRPDWIAAIPQILQDAPRCRTEELIRCHHTCHCP